ncbi:MAG: S-adenosylmethionine decarboxylase family protein [Pirellula sp.]
MLGCEWIVDAFGCDPEHLRDLTAMSRLCDNIVINLGLTVVGKPTWYQFPGQAGVTGLYLLSESHLACHTYPEVGVATLNLYCCRQIPDVPWKELLGKALHASHSKVIYVPRGESELLRPENSEELGL